MKVALIHYRLILRGGLETRLLNYIDYFHRRGDEVSVICSKRSEAVLLPEGVHFHRIRLGLMPKPYRKRYFSHLLGKYMARHEFDFSLSLGRTGHQDAVLAAANHIGYMKALGKSRPSRTDTRQIYLDQLAFDRSRIVYAASQMMKDELVAYFHVPPEKIHVLFPPLNVERYHRGDKARQGELKAQWGLDPDKHSFLFVSASHDRKGLPLLLKVFEQLQGEPFELAIAGYPKVDPGLPNVRYLGFHADLCSLYAAADATIHPALYEPFGQIISESLAVGTPVMVSHMVGAKEIIDDHLGRVIPSFAPEAWVEAIRTWPEQGFDIPPDIALRKGLSLDQHMERMLALWDSVKDQGTGAAPAGRP